MRSKLKKLVIASVTSLFKCARLPIKWYWKKFNIKTRGVRIMIIHDHKLILVRHWYNSLYVMPGGGIKKHETPEQAAIREIREELGLRIKQLDYQLGVYSNTKEGKNDTVYCFVVHLDCKPSINKKRFNLEISDIEWSPLEKTPPGTSVATCTRISEYLAGDIRSHVRQWS